MASFPYNSRIDWYVYEEARETYEDAISEGKTAVLHEELLRGVHALSVGNLAPGAMIEVTTRWADTLRKVETSCGRLRIPMTVGTLDQMERVFQGMEGKRLRYADLIA